MKGVIYFCKAPEIGRVKTRLAKSIGDENTLEIYKTMLNNLLENSLHVKSFIAFDGNENIIPSDLPRFAQKGDGLGERMKNAFLHLFEIGFTQVILVGADIPRIDEEILQSALESLDSHDGCSRPQTMEDITLSDSTNQALFAKHLMMISLIILMYTSLHAKPWSLYM